MKKYVLIAALLSSTSSFAFPAYNIVSCTGNLEGHQMYFEYNRANHMLKAQIDDNKGNAYANESGNKIYTNPEYDEDGNLLVLEIASNPTNWNANFNIYVNKRLEISVPLNCKKLGLTIDTSASSMTSLISTLKTPK